MTHPPRLAYLLLALIGCSSPTSPGGSKTVEATDAPTATSTPPPSVDARAEETTPDPREAPLAKSIEQLLSQEHVRHQLVDDAVSKEAFPKYLEQLDGGKLFLLQEHVTALSVFSDKMDDELRDGNLVLARRGAALLSRRREVVAKMVSDILAKPLDFTKDDQLETDPKKLAYATTEAELADRWEKFLKLQVLERVAALEDTQTALATKKPTDDEDAVKRPPVKIPPTLEGKEEKARQELATSYSTRFTRMADMEPLEPAERFINAVTAIYDPHTTYLPPAEKENFDIQITGTLEGIGASLGEEDHFIIVRELVPGGASWQQGKLEAGDLILAVAQEGKDPVDVTDMPIDKVVKMIRGPKTTVVTLTVKKPDGRVVDISITRDVVHIEASYARGAILDLGPKNEPMGYILLPSFYGDTRKGANRAKERNATDDLRKLLEKFEAKKLSGVIIDLRGNGGGLLGHARDITGLLIEKGPVVQTKSSNGKIDILEDKDPAVAFNGDVVVMTDRFSASASEILAGALQDYKRAVIVGTDQTHGKGTVQALVDLDSLGGRPTGEPMGVLKLTIEQYFRVNGESTQWRGVVPDIVTPDPASYVDSHERSLDHTIPWSKVDPLPIRVFPHRWNESALSAASLKRQAGEPAFLKVDAFTKLLKARRDDTVVPLKRDVWLAERKSDKVALDGVKLKLDEGKARFDVAIVDDPDVKIAPKPAGDKSSGDKGDKKVKGRLDKWRDELGRDPWVEEALRVLEDMKSARP